MENYRKTSHCTYDIKYHLVWITKYRKPVQYIKGNTSGKLQMEYKELNGQFQGSICGQGDTLWQAVET